jgi:hypothetical protein
MDMVRSLLQHFHKLCKVMGAPPGSRGAPCAGRRVFVVVARAGSVTPALQQK